MIHFDIDQRYQDEAVVGSAISRREGAILSAIVHGSIALLLIFGPRLPIFQKSPEDLARQRPPQVARREQPMFVFVEPKVDVPSKRAPERAPLSDKNRQARTPTAAPKPSNPLPFSRGNSADRTEAAEPARARQAETPAPPTPPQPEPPPPDAQVARNLPPADRGLPREPVVARPPRTGTLGEALRNLQQYVQNQTFNNPAGGQNDPGSQIQFDTKGVEFGPWLRRFVAQVRHNWFVPQAAMNFKGRVVLQFNIHKNGRITDLTVQQPANIDAFTRAAYNAILGSNPTEPLPPEYPDEKALFTVTFYYNEQP